MSFAKGLGIILGIGIGNVALFSGIPGWMIATAPAVLFVTICLARRVEIST